MSVIIFEISYYISGRHRAFAEWKKAQREARKIQKVIRRAQGEVVSESEDEEAILAEKKKLREAERKEKEELERKEREKQREKV